ncbi:MAG: DUF521 domain-containing protein [Erysipelotrichia bacterium]|nr:DUF521 domain-containing protein [Erysipelotrichia bacterium]
MKLTKPQIAILRGEQGETKQKMLETIVRFGDIFNASRLIKMTHKRGHLVTSFGLNLLKPLYKTMAEISANDIKATGGFTVDPRPVDYPEVKANLLEKIVFSKIMYGKQAFYEEQLRLAGLSHKNAFTCTPYLKEVGNRPKEGDILSWAESSAVVFANSVLGARCNRNSGMIDLFGTLLGYVPLFGLLSDEGRQATWKVIIKTSSLPEAQILGSAIGMKVNDAVPYIIGLDHYLGEAITDEVEGYLKDFGAATASNGAVGLYHIDGLTPEAKKLGKTLIKENAKEYVIDDEELEKIYRSYPVMWKHKDKEANLVFIGCPHLTLTQLRNWSMQISEGLKETGHKKVVVRTILTTAPMVLELFKRETLYKEMVTKGVKFTSICPLMYTNNPLTKRRRIVTNSNKLRTYSHAKYQKDEEILNCVIGRKTP